MYVLFLFYIFCIAKLRRPLSLNPPVKKAVVNRTPVSDPVITSHINIFLSQG